MNMKSSIVLSFIIFFISCSWYNDSQFTNLGFGLPKLINEHEFEFIADLFYLPDTIENVKLDSMRMDLINKLTITSNFIGNITIDNLSESSDMKYQIILSSIDQKQIHDKTRLQSGYFPSKFSNFKNGFFGITTYNQLFKSLELVSITFDIPSIDKDSIDLLTSNNISVKKIYSKEVLISEFGDLYYQTRELLEQIQQPNIEPSDEFIIHGDLYLRELKAYLPFLYSCKSEKQLFNFIYEFNDFETAKELLNTQEMNKFIKEYENFSPS